MRHKLIDFLVDMGTHYSVLNTPEGKSIKATVLVMGVASRTQQVFLTIIRMLTGGFAAEAQLPFYARIPYPIAGMKLAL